MTKAAPAKKAALLIRDRIKEFRRVPASSLRPNPKNWRRHPDFQRSALEGVLKEVGYAAALIARETPAGLELIDGHLRAETTPDQEVPVLIVDLDDREADYVLATLDPLGALAETNNKVIQELAENVGRENAAVVSLLERIGGIVPDFQPVSGSEQGALDSMKKIRCPECGHEFTR